MDNLGGGGFGSSLIFYQRQSEIRHRKSDIHQKCMPKPILAGAQVPQRVIKKKLKPTYPT